MSRACKLSRFSCKVTAPGVVTATVATGGARKRRTRMRSERLAPGRAGPRARRREPFNSASRSTAPAGSSRYRLSENTPGDQTRSARSISFVSVCMPTIRQCSRKHRAHPHCRKRVSRAHADRDRCTVTQTKTRRQLASPAWSQWLVSRVLLAVRVAPSRAMIIPLRHALPRALSGLPRGSGVGVPPLVVLGSLCCLRAPVSPKAVLARARVRWSRGCRGGSGARAARSRGRQSLFGAGTANRAESPTLAPGRAPRTDVGFL